MDLVAFDDVRRERGRLVDIQVTQPVRPQSGHLKTGKRMAA
jgi:hypothetical protein